MIYIDRRIADVETITMLIRRILFELHVHIDALRWERRNSPEL